MKSSHILSALEQAEEKKLHVMTDDVHALEDEVALMLEIQKDLRDLVCFDQPVLNQIETNIRETKDEVTTAEHQIIEGGRMGLSSVKTGIVVTGTLLVVALAPAVISIPTVGVASGWLFWSRSMKNEADRAEINSTQSGKRSII